MVWGGGFDTLGGFWAVMRGWGDQRSAFGTQQSGFGFQRSGANCAVSRDGRATLTRNTIYTRYYIPGEAGVKGGKNYEFRIMNSELWIFVAAVGGTGGDARATLRRGAGRDSRESGCEKGFSHQLPLGHQPRPGDSRTGYQNRSPRRMTVAARGYRITRTFPWSTHGASKL